MDVPPGRRMRLLAPAALIVVSVLLLAVFVGWGLGGSASEEGKDGPDRTRSGQRGEEPGSGERPRGPAVYRVKVGDTLGSISEQTGRSAGQLEELNPGLDAQALQPGQRLKLRE